MSLEAYYQRAAARKKRAEPTHFLVTMSVHRMKLESVHQRQAEFSIVMSLCRTTAGKKYKAWYTPGVKQITCSACLVRREEIEP